MDRLCEQCKIVKLRKKQLKFCSRKCFFDSEIFSKCNIGKSSWNKGIPHTEIHKKHLREARIGMKLSEEHKQHIREGVLKSTMLESVRSEKNRSLHRKLMLDRIENGYAPKKIFNTKPELKMKEILTQIGLTIGKAKDINDVVFQKRFHNHMIDFWHRKLNLYIHVDGRYHHNLPKIMKIDREVEEMILEDGAWYIRFWHDDIMKEPELVKDILVRLGVTKM